MTVLLTTGRLVLRRFTADDVDRLVELDADPEVMRHLTGGRPTPREVVEREILPLYAAYEERYGGAFGWWAAERRAAGEPPAGTAPAGERPDGGAPAPAGEFLGWFEFRPPDHDAPREVELGYRLRRSAWGRGLATEGARALVDRGFAELGVERVVAYTMAVNRGSRRVMEKAGLRHVRTFFEEWPEPLPGSEHGEVEYALTAAEWARRRR